MAGFDQSLPSRERGLKLCTVVFLVMSCSSLPSRERGLKSVRQPGERLRGESLPSRERGLKWLHDDIEFASQVSLPSRERGLKFRIRAAGTIPPGVAPFTGAWIEISGQSAPHPVSEVAPFTGAWIEISRIIAIDICPQSRSLHGSVD